MADQTDPGAAAREAAVASFVMFAQQALDLTAAIRRGLRVLVDVLAVPGALLVRQVGPNRVAVVDALTPHDMVGADDELDVDPTVLGTPVSRVSLLPGRCGPAEGPERSPGSRAERAARPGGRADRVDSRERRADPDGLCLALHVEGRPWGLLGVCGTSDRDFGPGEVTFARAMAAVIGTALERRRAEVRQGELIALARFAVRNADVAPVIRRAIQVAMQLADAPVGAAIRVERFPSTLMVVHAHGAPGLGLGLEYEVDPALGDALRGPDPVLVEDSRTDGRFTTPILPAITATVAALAVNLAVEGRAGSHLVVGDRRPRAFSRAEQTAVRDVADLLAAALTRDRRERTDLRRARREATRLPQEQDTEVALVDTEGVIIWVNRAWEDFCRDNDGDPARTGVGMSYLALCDAAGDPVADQVGAALRSALRGELPAPMAVLIPCHSPQEERWYDVLISSRHDDSGTCMGATVTLSRAEHPD